MGKKVPARRAIVNWEELSEGDEHADAIKALAAVGIRGSDAARLVDNFERACPEPDPNATEIRFHRMCLVYMRKGLPAAEAEKLARKEAGPKKVGRRAVLPIRSAIIEAASFFKPAARKDADVRRAIYYLARLTGRGLGYHRHVDPARLVKDVLAGLPADQVRPPAWDAIYAAEIAAEVADDLASGIELPAPGKEYPYQLLYVVEQAWRSVEETGEPIVAFRAALDARRREGR